jgi:hypothetical protein
MITDIDKYVEFLCHHRLNEHQFLILWLIHTKDTKSIAKYKDSKGNFNIHDIQYLIDIGFIDDFGLSTNNPYFNIFDFIVTDKFSKVVVIDEEDSYEELCKVYPPWIKVQGTKYPTITGDPRVISKDYFKCHKGNRLAHQRIVDITKRYYNVNPPTGKIHNYILNRQWNLLEEELNLGVGSDAFKVL